MPQSGPFVGYQDSSRRPTPCGKLRVVPGQSVIPATCRVFGSGICPSRDLLGQAQPQPPAAWVLVALHPANGEMRCWASLLARPAGRRALSRLSDRS
jgi:hypothetical protein